MNVWVPNIWIFIHIHVITIFLCKYGTFFLCLFLYFVKTRPLSTGVSFFTDRTSIFYDSVFAFFIIQLRLSRQQLCICIVIYLHICLRLKGKQIIFKQLIFYFLHLDIFWFVCFLRPSISGSQQNYCSVTVQYLKTYHCNYFHLLRFAMLCSGPFAIQWSLIEIWKYR